jgi:hypothetical protein
MTRLNLSGRGAGHLRNPVARAAFVALLCGATVMPLGCGGGEDPVTPLFEYIFRDERLDYNGTIYSVSLSLSPTNPTTSTGSFTGVRIAVEEPSAEFQEGFGTGSFDGCTLQLSFAGTPGQFPPAAPPLSTKYAGRFTSNDTMVLKDAAGTALPDLVLQRSQPGTRNMGCK